MGFDLPVFISAGIQDALSPMQLAIAGIYAVMMLHLRQTRTRVLFISAGLFIGMLFIFGVMFHVGFFEPVTTSPIFLSQTPWVLLALGSVCVAFGLLFLWEWRALRSGFPRKFAAFIPMPPAGMRTGLALSFFLAGGLAFLSNIWPVNYQVLIQREMAFTPGRFFYSLGAFCVYEFFRNGAVLFVFLVFILTRREENAAFLRRKRSLVAIIVSAFYLAVGGSLFFFFYVAATKPWM